MVLAWVVVALFILTTIGHVATHRSRVVVGVLAWTSFAAFWLRLLPRFAVRMHSIVETIGAVVAVLACLFIAYRLRETGADSIFQLTEAVAIAGGVYLVAATIPPVRSFLIEAAAHHTHSVLVLTGFDPSLQATAGTDLVATLEFRTADHTYATHLVFACTGAGAMAAFTGLVSAVDAPRRRRVATIAVLVSAVWVLNLARNVFIAAAFGEQWFQLFVPTVLAITGYTDPGLVSYVIADRVIAQSVSVVAVVGLCALTVRLLPPIADAATALLDTLTGTTGPPPGQPPGEGVPGD